jgi:hypothetical protein
MAKDTVERPRILEGIPRKGRRAHLEDLPLRMGMRRDRHLHGGYKMLNENLSPLRRYLEGQLGRRWDDVYSDICANLKVDSTVQQHVRDHVRDFVEILPRNRDEACVRSWVDLYVDPDDGILKRGNGAETRAADRRRWKAMGAKARDSVVRIDAMRELRLIEGIWYEVGYAPLPEPVYRDDIELRRIHRRSWDVRSPFVEYEVKVRRLVSRPVYDVLVRGFVRVGPEIDTTEGRRKAERDGRRYAVSKRQASSATLRRYGLRNGLETSSRRAG